MCRFRKKNNFLRFSQKNGPPDFLIKLKDLFILLKNLYLFLIFKTQ